MTSPADVQEHKKRVGRWIHVHPVNDLREHVFKDGGDCWCQPKIERFSTGKTVVTHRSMDGRELIEQHGVN